MRFASLDHFGIDPFKIALLGAAVAASTAFALQLAFGDLLSGAASEFDLVVSLVVFYMFVSSPRRKLDSIALAQSREAPNLAILASLAASSSHSRAQAMLALRPMEPEVSQAMKGVRKAILLGSDIQGTVLKAAESLTSSSAADALRKAVVLSPESVEEGDQEARGIVGALALADESKLPIFMTVCFFTPILLVLFAAFSHLNDAQSLAELLGVQFVVLDVSYFFSSVERRRLK